jgi:hypothetical protein
MAKPMGRRPKFEPGTEFWHFTARWPRAVRKAFNHYATDQDKDMSEILLEHLEGLLTRGGYLKVHARKDPETGDEVKSYEAVEK